MYSIKWITKGNKDCTIKLEYISETCAREIAHSIALEMQMVHVELRDEVKPILIFGVRNY